MLTRAGPMVARTNPHATEVLLTVSKAPAPQGPNSMALAQ